MIPASVKAALGVLALWVSFSTAAAVEIDTANEAELDSVRGLGPSSTARILKAREAGPFADWQDVMRRVKGIKQATAQKLLHQELTVNGQALYDTPIPPSTPLSP
jgi:competence protein ComEA